MSVIFRYALLFGIILCSLACESRDEEATIDIINVVRKGATIPAYIYGNTGSNLFIIYLHGGPGSSGLAYKVGEFSERLETDYAVVYTDQRAQGMSQGNIDPLSLTPELLAGDVHALALALRSKYGQDIDIFLMGHSWGGTLGSTVMINDTFASQYSGWIDMAGAHDLPLTFTGGWRKVDSVATEQLALENDVDFWTDAQSTLEDIDTTEMSSEDKLALNILAFDGEQTLSLSDVIALPQLDVAFDQLKYSFFVNNSITAFFSGNAANSALFENSLDTFSLESELSNINTPTLLIWGRYDMVVPLELGFQALNAISAVDKSLLIFERSGHSPFVNEAEGVTDSVVEFIERNRK